MPNSANDLFRAGQLDDAMAALTAEVKARPTDMESRTRLAELLCFSGNLERADTLLDAISLQRPELAVSVALFRQLIRGESIRAQVFGEGRAPDVLDDPTPWMTQSLLALTHLRAGDGAAAAAVLAEAEESRPKVTGTCDDRRFDGFRDLDDVTAGIVEVLTSTGKYFWVPLERVVSVEFHAPTRVMDLIWRRASMSVAGGPDGDVYIPVLYTGSAASGQDALRLGRATEWVGEEGQVVRGLGQRSFLVGEEDCPIMQIGTIAIDQPEG